MQRRHFFRQSAASLAALMGWQRLFGAPPSPLPALRHWSESGDVFSLGVASGEPLPDSVVLWTRLAPHPLQPDGGMPPQPVAVRWEVAHDPRFGQLARQGEAIAEPGRAHSLHIEVDGLQSDRVYYYRFIVAGQASPVGRTRTAPAADARVRQMRLALASCQHYEMGAFTAHREIASADVDVVLFVGDYIYETQTVDRLKRRHHLVSFAEGLTLDRYRVHHAQYKRDPDLRACHAAHPWLLMWDDHEVRNDYDGKHDGYGLGERDFLLGRAAGYQAYFEHLPVSPRRAPVGPDALMHARYSWGQLADIWLLDTRQYRSAPACTDPVHSPWSGRLLWRCDATAAPERTMFGLPQERWLADSLAASRGAWRLLAQTTQISPGRFRLPGQPLLYSDGWDAFPAARERLMAAIAQPRVPDVVCLGGDVHRHVGIVVLIC